MTKPVIREWPPFESKMESLSELKTSLTLSMALRHAFPGENPPKHEVSEINTAFIRLVDKAILEYERARKHLETYASEKYPMRQPLNLYRAADEFENCITSIHRAMRFLKKIKEDICPQSTYLKSVIQGMEKVAEFRNGIHHMDEDILAKKINPTGALGIKACVSYIENRRLKIKYIDLVKWIRKMHNFAKELSE